MSPQVQKIQLWRGDFDIFELALERSERVTKFVRRTISRPQAVTRLMIGRIFSGVKNFDKVSFPSIN